MLLTGWKEIASYLRLGVRTVQRWEREGLPVIRPTNSRRGHIVAYTEQIDAWLKRPNGRGPEMPILIEVERTHELLLKLAEQRKQMTRRLDELRRELATLRKNHRKTHSAKHPSPRTS